MFEIKFRIVDDLDYLREIAVEQFDNDGADIEGFFSLDFNGNVEGYYHDNNLREGEVGHELITLWFDLLVEVILLLEETKYVILKEIECYDTWIEFILEDNDLKVSLAKYSAEESTQYIFTTPQKGLKYSIWKDIIIPFELFRNEVMHKGKEYIDRVAQINPVLLKSKVISKLLNKIRGISGS
ncbi:MAG: hypothetical protein KAX49_20830 [Halanaerobiales bacterium]|nr:hypothetical protein [Halanaerobiales bacterium]